MGLVVVDRLVPGCSVATDTGGVVNWAGRGGIESQHSRSGNSLPAAGPSHSTAVTTAASSGSGGGTRSGERRVQQESGAIVIRSATSLPVNGRASVEKYEHVSAPVL